MKAKTPKTTKGKWEVSLSGGGALARIMVNPDNPMISENICSLSGNAVEGKIEANAKLIASAPELLEALKEMSKEVAKAIPIGSDAHYISVFKSHQKALQAIKKAEGKETMKP